MDDKDTTNPAELVETAVEHCLTLAATWLAWDGRPLVAEDGARIYTPHKAVRRIADHITDHLAEVEALLAGVPTQPDEWHASLVTLDSDWARFTEADLDEARQRLRRLGRTFALRYTAAGPAEWDVLRGENWTLREIATHLAGITWYADQVGDLMPARPLAAGAAEG
ncbi:MAG TPA: hypothetical protein VGJ44_02575 [Kribbellaceae bacterium]|jgi:hypothetical protein